MLPDEIREQRWRDYFAPMLQIQTYLNLIYLVLAFPLGVTYFSLLIAGWATGFSLLVILIGVPILALVIEGAEWMLRFERFLSNALLGTDIPIIPQRKSDTGWINRIRQHLTSGLFWRGQIYLIAKFAFGIVALVSFAIVWSIPAALIFAPFAETEVTFGAATWTSAPAPIAFLISIIGLLLIPFSARVSNRLIDWWSDFAVSMLAEQAYDPYDDSKAKFVTLPEVDDATWDEPDSIYDGYDYDEKPKRNAKHKTLAELLGEVESDHLSGR